MIAVLDGCHAVEGVVLSVLVVVDEEAPRCFADIVQSGEQVAVEHILAVSAVEAFDVGVLVGFAGLDVLDRQTEKVSGTISSRS